MKALLLLLLLAPAVEVPFELDRGHDVLLVRAAVNDKPALLILDTGATKTMLAPEALGIDSFQMKRSRFVDGGFDGRGVWSEATLGLGDARWRRTVGAVDMRVIRETYHRPIDGLLGQDFLRQFKRVVIDYEKGTVRLESQDPR